MHTLIKCHIKQQFNWALIVSQKNEMFAGINKHLEEVERADCFAIIVLRMSCYCKCSVTLPHRAVGWSGVYNCGIYRPYKLLVGLQTQQRDMTNMMLRLLLFSMCA